MGPRGQRPAAMSPLELIAVFVWSFAVSFFGGRFTGRLDERQLIQAMAAILVVSGTAMAAQAIFG